MTIDVFNHFMPLAVLDQLRQRVPGHMALGAFPKLPTLWDVDARLPRGGVEGHEVGTGGEGGLHAG